MNDQVQVTGFLGSTPSLRFVGRRGVISDLFGEKLSEPFVAKVIHELLLAYNATSSFALLAPDTDASGWRYKLFVEGTIPENAENRLDDLLRQNPHYDTCRRLGQLQIAKCQNIPKQGHEKFVSHYAKVGMRLGEIKPAVLSHTTDWSKVYTCS
jgi:hypothetical protein